MQNEEQQRPCDPARPPRQDAANESPHSFDSVVYALELAGRRVIFTGDPGFHVNNDILNRCWGDVPKARRVMAILREQVLPMQPEFVLTGHDEHTNGVAYWEGILRTTEEAIRKAEAQRKE
jgi:glyoxylase-like metal-dependent hydrolase (beta-lactamase superfamily II)